MRVLALADKRPLIDPATMARQKRVDAVFCLGDLDRAWIESLMSLDIPRYGVHGNHDPEHVLRELEIEDLHLRRTQRRRRDHGRRLRGLRALRQRHAPHQYTQREASKLAKRLPAADVLLCHCPPLGINDDPEDPAHIGFEGLRDWVDRHQPRHVLHGHTHPLPGQVDRPLRRHEGPLDLGRPRARPPLARSRAARSSPWRAHRSARAVRAPSGFSGSASKASRPARRSSIRTVGTSRLSRASQRTAARS